MIKLLIPLQKNKGKVDIRGFWIDKGRIYYDYLKAVKIDRISKRIAKNYCRYYNQLAIFYSKGKEGFIYTKKTGQIDKLGKKLIFRHTGRAGLKTRLKNLLSIYNGLTVYITGKVYIIEVYYN